MGWEGPGSGGRDSARELCAGSVVLSSKKLLSRAANATSYGLVIFRRIYRAMAIELPRPQKHAPASFLGRLLPLAKPLLDVDSVVEKRRRRIWEISSSLHCSIIGTCLTTTELRQIFIKMEFPGAHRESDHELHGRAVLLA